MLDSEIHNFPDVKANPSIFVDFVAEGELSPERMMRLHAHLLSVMRSREYQWFQFQNGVLDETAWRTYQYVIPLSLGTTRTRKWWKDVGHTGFDPEFVEIVDGLLEGPTVH